MPDAQADRAAQAGKPGCRLKLLGAASSDDKNGKPRSRFAAVCGSVRAVSRHGFMKTALCQQIA